MALDKGKAVGPVIIYGNQCYVCIPAKNYPPFEIRDSSHRIGVYMLKSGLY